MGSSMLVSSTIHHHLIRHEASAYDYDCRMNLHEMERESERKRKYLVQLKCKRTRSTYFTLLSTANEDWAPVQKFVEPSYFDTWNRITGSCHGVLHFTDNTVNEDELLWMPLTNQIKVLPRSKVPRPPRPPLSYDFIPIGFGFDSKSQDYKLARGVYYMSVSESESDEDSDYCSDFVAQMELYSLKTDSWKQILEFPIEIESASTRVHLNGSLYWWSSLFTEYIFSFDLTTEEFSRLASPTPDQTTCDQFCKLVEVDGKLGIMIYDLNDQLTKWGLELFVLGDDGKSWLKEFDIYGLVGVRRPKLYDSDAHLLFIEGDRDDKGLWVYDIHTGELKKLGLSDEFVDVSPYVGSSSAPWA